jgi:two-component sensor histidine kinase
LASLKLNEEASWSVQVIPMNRSGPVPGTVIVIATNTKSQAALVDTIEKQENTIERQEGAIDQQAKLLKLLMANVPWGVTIVNSDAQIDRISDFGSNLLGHPREAFEGRTLKDTMTTSRVFHEDGSEVLIADLPLMRAIHRGEIIIGEEWFVADETGRKRRTLLCNAAPMRDGSGAVIGGISTYGDITPLKDMLISLRRMVDQKEVLLGELHHRVKNNLQTVATIAIIEKLRHPEAAEALDNVIGHVSAVACIHETLGLSPDACRIPFATYLRKVCLELRNLYNATNVEIHVSGAEELPLDVATPLGLIVNELVTNSLKHAFIGRDGGAVTITLTIIEGSYRLEVGDDGIGLPQSGEPYRQSLGQRLVDRLVHQLGGALQTNSTPGKGTTRRVTFPLEAKDRHLASH